MNVLITGGASGIGLASALYFSERGHRVFTIDVKDAEKNTGVEHFVSDITDEDTLFGVKRALSDRDIRLDAIISVAGIHTMQSLVEGETDGMKRLIDINLFGAMLTVRVFHEMLVEKGRVIIVTSEVATYTPMPFNGLYNVSKTALDCYADALRQELNLLGQRVIAIRPGAVATPLARGSADSTERLAESTRLYSKEAKHFGGLVSKFTGTPIAPDKIAKTVYIAATKRRPKYAYAKHRNIGLVLLNVLPKPLQCFIIKALLHRK